jgi:hypothetical protein
MANTVPFPNASQSASQQYTFEAPSGFAYVLHKLPATRYLALSNALVTYFGEPTIKAIIAMVKEAKTEDVAAVEKKSNAEMMELIASALEESGGLGRIPLDAFQMLARLVCPFISVSGKPPVNPDELNVKMVDAKIDFLFQDCPSDVVPVVGRAIAFNLADFFSGGPWRLTPKPPKSKSSNPQT